MRATDNMRTAAEVLVDALINNGVRHVFCVPGESYLAVLDASHDRDLSVTVCRQEGGAAMMAEAVGKATGRPGICFVTRGPGATNAAPGLHIAQQDSTPMILFVGQVARGRGIARPSRNSITARCSVRWPSGRPRSTRWNGFRRSCRGRFTPPP